MSGLTQKDLQVLAYYAENGNRERYWNYLAALPNNDGYGLLALGVVRNDNVSGAVANTYAQNYAKEHPVNGKAYFNEQEWEKIGIDLIREDFRLRKAHVQMGRVDLALNLSGHDVYEAHKNSFLRNNLSPQAWTPAALFDAASKQTGASEKVEEIWRYMLKNDNLGVTRVTSTLVDQWALRRGVREGYLGDLSTAFVESANVMDYKDKNRIGKLDSFYYKENGAWFHAEKIIAPAGTMAALMGSDDWIHTKETNPKILRELDVAYQVREHRDLIRNQKAVGDNTRDLLPSPRTLGELDTPTQQQTATAPEIQLNHPKAIAMHAALEQRLAGQLDQYSPDQQKNIIAYATAQIVDATPMVGKNPIDCVEVAPNGKIFIDSGPFVAVFTAKEASEQPVAQSLTQTNQITQQQDIELANMRALSQQQLQSNAPTISRV